MLASSVSENKYIVLFIVIVLKEWWMIKRWNGLSARWYNKLVRTTFIGHMIILWRVNLLFNKSQIQMVIVFLIPIVICPFLVFPKFIVCIVYRQKANFRTFLSPKPTVYSRVSISVFLLLHISRLLHFLAKNRMMKTTMTKAATTLEMSNSKLATWLTPKEGVDELGISRTQVLFI